MDAPANDNVTPSARMVPIIGVIADNGQVTITDPTWRATPHPASPPPFSPFPNDAREP